MKQEEVRRFLREMGFSEPCPEYTMSKLIPLKTGEVISLQVWASDDPYVYFDTLKVVSYKYPYELLGIDYDLYYSTPVSKLTHSLYPKVTCKEDVEDICLKLTGKSIYDINIKEPDGLREKLLAINNSIINFGKPVKEESLFKSFFKRIFA